MLLKYRSKKSPDDVVHNVRHVNLSIFLSKICTWLQMMDITSIGRDFIDILTVIEMDCHEAESARSRGIGRGVGRWLKVKMKTKEPWKVASIWIFQCYRQGIRLAGGAHRAFSWSCVGLD
jgi:hypothetical protein